ncbi:MAG: hypothetical protein AB7P21_00245 [Lautropia sp.]
MHPTPTPSTTTSSRTETPEALGLPGYVRDRNSRLIAAGLTMTQSTAAAGSASHWFDGTHAQFDAAQLRKHSRRSTYPTRGRRPRFCQFTSPAFVGLVGTIGADLIALRDGTLRLVIADEPIPMAETLIESGLTRYECVDEIEGSVVVHVGEPEALLARGILPRALVNKHGGLRQRLGIGRAASGVATWAWDRLADGTVRVRHFVDAEARHERQEREATRLDRPKYRDLDDVRARLAMVSGLLDAVCGSDLDGKGSDGTLYRIAGGSREAIALAVLRLKGALQEAVVETVAPERRWTIRCEREALQAARQDVALQAFVGAVVGRHGRGGRQPA